MDKKLPIIVPPIKAFVYNAYILAIILQHENVWEWFYNNYIHLYFDTKEIDDPFNFYYTDYSGSLWNARNTWLEYEEIERNFLSFMNIDLVDVVKFYIDNNWYIELYWDEFFVPNGLTQGKIHFWHRTLIYGYDDIEKIVYTYGYKNNSNYESCVVSYSDFRKSYYSDFNCNTSRPIYLMKFNSEKQFKFDIINVLNQISDYLCSKDLTEPNRNNFNKNKDIKFGFATYESIINHYAKKSSNKNQKISYMPLYVLYEHKKTMLSRLKFLQNNKYIQSHNTYIKDYEIIVKNASILGPLFFKYIYTNNKTLLDKLISKIGEIKDLEKIVLEKLLFELNNKYRNNRS